MTLIHKWYTIPSKLAFTGSELNLAILRDPVLKLDIETEKTQTNDSGIYHDQYTPTKTGVHCYYACDATLNDHVKAPPGRKLWFHTIPSVADEVKAMERMTRMERLLPNELIDLITKAGHLLNKEEEEERERVAKRQRLDGEESTSVPNESSSNETPSSTAETPSEPDVMPTLPAGTNIFWASTDAKKLFNALAKETSIDRLDDLIAILGHANNSPAVGYKAIVYGHDADNTLSEHKKAHIRQKALYLACAYREAREEMPYKTWNNCCQDAINIMAKAGVNHITNAKVLERWNVEFRQKTMFTPKCRGKRDLPAFLEAHPIVVTVMKEYGREHLADLSIEMMHSYLHETILKSLVAKRQSDKSVKMCDKEYLAKSKELMKEFGLTCICRETVYSWMLQLGFRHETGRKGYYVDGHEREGTVEYRWSFCEHYLQLERQMHRWIQITADEAKVLVEAKKVREDSGYRYHDECTGRDMVEFHVDTCRELMERMNNQTEFGGNLSVQIEGQHPIIVMGQDECIVKQYLCTQKAWVGPDGEQALIPKD